MFMGMQGVQVDIHVRRPEINLGCYPQVPYSLFFEIESLIGLELIHSTSTAGSKAPGSPWLDFPKGGNTRMCHHIWPL